MKDRDSQDIALKIHVYSVQGDYLGGNVDIRLEHRRLKDELRELSNVDASREIEISDLRRDSIYRVFVKLPRPQKQSQGKVVEIPASGFATLEFVFARKGEPDELGGPFEVRGVVRYASGMGASGVQVLAFDRDLRNEELLGGALTAFDGAYRIGYSASQILRRERGSADLVVKALGADGEELDISPVMFNAPPQAKIDLTIPLGRGPALYDRIAVALEPLLGDLAVTDLEEIGEVRDISFLAGETGFAKRDLARFALSHHLVALGLESEFWFALLGGSVFKYSETRSLQDLRTAVEAALVSVNELAVRRALDRAFAIHDIRAGLAEMTEEWIETFLGLTAQRALGDPQNPTFLRLALDDAGIDDPERQARFAGLFNKYRALTPQLLAELEQDSTFTEAEIADLRTSYRLADLTRGDFSVVRALKTDFTVRRPEQIRTLAKRGESEWIQWTESKYQAGEIELPLRLDTDPAGPIPVPEAEIYGRSLGSQFRLAFPTTAFTGGLERALAGDGPRGLRRGEDLGPFLDHHTSFELHRTQIDTFLDNGVDPDFQELAQDQDFRLELKGVQRVFKLAPTFEATDTLLADGVHSAQGAYRMGESAFVQRYAERPGFTPDSAQVTWNRAADTQAAVITILGDLKARESGSLAAALTTGGEEEALAEFPNWENLFRAGDLCHCEHCRSVLGPAAYFADLLMYLGDRKEPPADSTDDAPEYGARDVLFRRRPDLGWLELNCENAHTTLPYVDVVCEVLESAVDADGENELVLSGFTTVPSDPDTAKTAVADAFVQAFADSDNRDKQKVPLGSEFSLSQVDPADPDRWVVHGDGATYLLKKNGTADFFSRLLSNTKAKSDELRAYPAYVNPRAYAKLEEAPFPFSLPFDLFAEEVRAGFRKSRMERWDLMRTLRGAAPPNNPSDGDIAAEYFGISSDPGVDFDEKGLILEADTTVAGQQARWGEVGTSQWLSKLSNVKTFLGKTGLKYEELLALIDLPFVKATGSISIEHLDSSCDTDQKRLQGLNRTRLDRIHRFLRLWRKLDGWEMWELDLVIGHPAIGKKRLDEALLVALYHFERLRRRLGAKVTVEQVCALLGDLNTETHFVEAHEPRGDALYHSLFLNRRLIQPLDPAFEVAAVKPDSSPEKLPDHKPVILAALRVRETDLDQLASLPRTPVQTKDDLTLTNLSFLWRHAWLSKVLKLGVEEWRALLKLRQQDLQVFSEPKEVLDFVELVDQVLASGLTVDELDWILAANRSAKAAPKEPDVARFLTSLRSELSTIRNEYDPDQDLPTDEGELTEILTSLLLQLHREDAGARFFLDVLRGEVALEREEAALALKFFDPVFTVPLFSLPAEVDFSAISDRALRSRIAYDAGERRLRIVGILSPAEQEALEALSADESYLGAVAQLFNEPRTGDFDDDDLWLRESDLQLPLRNREDPAEDHLTTNLATAIRKALTYLSRTLAEDLVILQASAQLKLSEGLTHRLLTEYAVLPGAQALLAHLTGSFAATRGAVDFDDDQFESTFSGWYWAHRTAMAWNQWKLTVPDWEGLRAVTTEAHPLDFGAPPVGESVDLTPLERFLSTDRMLRFRSRVPETDTTLLEILKNLHKGATEAELAADVERMNEAWGEADTRALVTSWDLEYPADYFEAETWERLHRAFSFLARLNAGAGTASAFAAVAMTDENAKKLKELLRARFGSETWLTLSAEIQDELRERKRDALAAYLLSQDKPEDAPSGKWENTNDLYAYYLLDVEMSSCQLTSRLVQASGSVQLFVQRCFMGLEPNVTVQVDGEKGDSAWRWWKWMRKYRVWEANRKVFLWPENWIEPELKKDRSPFFKDLENELLQNDVNPYTVETAFANYLEKLDGVAQLEVAGFYQEDDGDNTILHVFGRTVGAEPHLYYYRRYDYRQWTPWEKVDLDIQGDYLIPAVVGGRLYLFWPVFTEIPNEEKNRQVKTPGPKEDAPVEKAWKNLRLQMAVSDYRQGIWTPRRISKQFAESKPFNVEIVHHHYRFLSIDRTMIDGRFIIQYDGYSTRAQEMNPAIDLGAGPVLSWLFPETLGQLSGAFEIAGCSGVPELTASSGSYLDAIRPEQDAAGAETVHHRWEELVHRADRPENDLTFENVFNTLSTSLQQTQVLLQTPWIFRISPPLHLSYLDRLWDNGLHAYGVDPVDEGVASLGSWLPFFYRDKKRTFFVLPSVWAGFREGQPGELENIWKRYPDVKSFFRELEGFFERFFRRIAEAAPPLPPGPVRKEVECFLHSQFPDETGPPSMSDDFPAFTDDTLRDLFVRFFMRFIHYFLGRFSFTLFNFRFFHFKNFYHPFVCDFAKLINDPLQGISGLMMRQTQLKNSGFSFFHSYRPTVAVVDPLWVLAPDADPADAEHYPEEIVDFSPDGAYSSYNWEIFFHAPLLIANTLSKNQRFEEARDWYHYIFNPLGVEGAGGSPISKYWITKPFFETTDEQYVEQRIENLLGLLAGEGDTAELAGQVVDWRIHPFEPHRIASYRTVAYQKTVVMKYLDNLIAWGDNLFRQDSMESLNEATQLYILAAEILGPRPKKIPPQAKPPLESFNELEADLDAFGNALVEVENLIPAQAGAGGTGVDQPPLPFLYFCIPHNEKLLGYWDTVADRLFKIRHCMNIEGVVRQLALFEPPIDPGALVKAVAGGLDIGAALADLSAPLPFYRFNVLLQKANEVCNDVKALGAALLSALEKKDAEALALLRQGQEIRVLEAVKSVREQQIEEAKGNLEALKKSQELARIREEYYDSREFINAAETAALVLSAVSLGVHVTGSVLDILGGALAAVPDFEVGASGFGGSPVATVKTGGSSFSKAAELAARALYQTSAALDKSSSLAGTLASYQRRQEDWDFQKDLAIKEGEQIAEQIAAAELRITIAEKELENHDLQIENAKATDEFMRSKYTNEELYQWQVGQISGVYFQSYRLAYDLAKRAERCFRFELGVQDSSLIQFGYWDSLKKGLLAGERLQYDLRRLDTAYLEQNRREFELTKYISLRRLNPLALVELREKGRCFFGLPEEIFDLDYPGHYFRRIKSVRLTLPSVTGPYTTISCTLRLLKNSIRIHATGSDSYPRNTDDNGLPAEDERFVENNIAVKAIATSSGQNDSGVFELSFRDERYLPFEGAGVVSEWALELFSDLPENNPDFGRPLRQFDYNSITDAVLHVSYTAREDAGQFKNAAIGHLREYFSPGDAEGATSSLLMLDLRRDFPTQWSRFLYPGDSSDGNVFELEVSHRIFLFRDTGKPLRINTIHLLARSQAENLAVRLAPQPPGPPPEGVVAMLTSDRFGGIYVGQVDVAASGGFQIAPTGSPVTWKMEVTSSDDGLPVEDLILVLEYQWEIS